MPIAKSGCRGATHVNGHKGAPVAVTKRISLPIVQASGEGVPRRGVGGVAVPEGRVAYCPPRWPLAEGALGTVHVVAVEHGISDYRKNSARRRLYGLSQGRALKC